MSIIPKISVKPFTQYLLELGLKPKTANTYVMALRSDNPSTYKSARPVARAKFEHWKSHVATIRQLQNDENHQLQEYDRELLNGYHTYLLGTIKLSYETCKRYVRAIQEPEGSQKYSSVKGSAMAYLNLYLKQRMDDKTQEEPRDVETEKESVLLSCPSKASQNDENDQSFVWNNDQSFVYNRELLNGYHKYLLGTIKLSNNISNIYVRAIQEPKGSQSFSSVKGSAMAFFKMYMEQRMDDKTQEEPREVEDGSSDWLLSYKEKKYAEELDTVMSPTEEETEEESVKTSQNDVIPDYRKVVVVTCLKTYSFQGTNSFFKVYPYSTRGLSDISKDLKDGTFVVKGIDIVETDFSTIEF